MELVVDVAARHDEDDGPIDIVQLRERRRAPRRLRPRRGCPALGIRLRPRARSSRSDDEEHATRDLAEDVDGERDRDANGEAVSEGRRAVALPRCRRPASDSAMTGASFAATPMRSVSAARAQTRRPMPPRRAPFPTGHDDRRRRLAELVEDLVGDRAVAVVLGRSRRRPRRTGGRSRRRGGGPLPSPRRDPTPTRRISAPSCLDQSDLRLGGALGRIDDGVQPEPLGRPGGRGAVVPCRGGDDGCSLRRPGRPAITGSAPRHLKAPSSCTSSRLRRSGSTAAERGRARARGGSGRGRSCEESAGVV